MMRDFRLNPIDKGNVADVAATLAEPLLNAPKRVDAVRVLGGVIERHAHIRSMPVDILTQELAKVACRNGATDSFEHVYLRILRRLAVHVPAICLLPDESGEDGEPGLELTLEKGWRDRGEETR